MTDNVKAGAQAPDGADVEKKIGYIGARLREKSTYGGLAVVIGLALPILIRQFPQLSGTNVETLANAISSIGIGIGVLIGVFLPEKSVVKILIAASLLSVALVPAAFAQTTQPQANTVLTAVETQLYAALNGVIGFAGGFVQADLNAAISDAQAQVPPNQQAIACWQTIAKIPVTSIPTGAGLAYLKQKFLDLQSLYMPLNLNCGSVAPLFLKSYNQFMSLAASQNL